MKKEKKSENSKIDSYKGAPFKDDENDKPADNLSDEHRQDVTGNLSISSSKSFSIGPLPHPDFLEKYEQILPGAAERIFTTSEMYRDANIEDNHELVKSEVGSTKRGQWFAFIISMTAIISGVLVALFESVWGGSSISIVTIIALLIIYAKSAKLQLKFGKGYGDDETDNEDEPE